MAIEIAKDTLKKNIDAINLQIIKACEKVSRDPKKVKLVCVIKNQENETIMRLIELGVNIFGENRLQELEKHQNFLQDRDIDINKFEWNFIGQMQKNKINKIASRASVIQSVDSIVQVEVLAKKENPPKILLQLSDSEIEHRGGVPFSRAPQLLEQAAQMGLSFQGVMIVPSLGIDPAKSFVEAKKFADDNALSEVSMGMTGDFQTAIECGSTTIRIGSAFFQS